MKSDVGKISYRWVVWIIAILATAVPWYLSSIWSIAGTFIQGEMNLSMSQFGLLGSIMMLGPAILSIPVGKLNIKYGSKPLICGGLVVMLVGTFLMTKANSFTMLLLMRLMQGLGFAFVWTPSQTLSAKWFTSDELSTAAGGNTVGLGLGGIIALISTPLVSGLGWRTYLSIATVGVLIILALIVFFTSSYPEQRGYCKIADIEKELGIASPSAETGSGSSESIFSWKFLSCFCLWFLCMGLYTTFTNWTPTVFKLKGWDLAMGGYITAMSLGFGVVALLLGGPLCDRLGKRHLQVRVCALILAITYAVVGFAPSPIIATISAIIAGTIAYYWNAPYVGLLGSMAPSGKFELVMGTNNCFASAGAVVLPYLMGIFTGSGDMKSLNVAFTLLLILGLVMFGLGFFMHETKKD